MQLLCLLLTVNLKGSRMPWDMVLWVYRRRIALTKSIGTGRNILAVDIP